MTNTKGTKKQNRIETLIQAVANAEQAGNETMIHIARKSLYRELDR